MKKIININLSSRLIPIEDSAYEILRQYLDSLKKYFSKEEGGDEIVSDIESRIAEVFQDKMKKGAHCITDDDVVAVKASMGTPEQFDDVPKENAQAEEEAYNYIPRPRKRLYRDPDNKVLSGVCSGLGAYFNIDPVIFRIIFALLAIGGFGTGILVYFILWVATPSADTAAEKLEMRGERVDLNNIKATIQDELHHMKNQMKNVGEDFRNFSQGRGRQVGNDLERFFVNLAHGLGKVLVFVTKGFFYFFAAVMLICLVAVGIAIAVSSAALFPLKNLLLTTTTQSYLFWPALGLLIGIPIVALLIFIIRKLTGVKQTNRYASYTLTFLWLIGLVFAAIVTSSLVKDFRRPGTETTAFALQQPSQGKLILKRTTGLLTEEDDFSMFDGNLLVADDTVIINNIRIRIEKSMNDSFAVDVAQYSRGRNVQDARQLAREIGFQLNQRDSILYLPEGFSIPSHSPFRGQRVTVVIKVPVGKNIEIDKEVYRKYSFTRHNRDDEWDFNNDDDDAQPLNLKMTPNGTDDAKPAKPAITPESKDSTEGGYRYKGNVSLNAAATGLQQASATVKAEIPIDKAFSFLAFSMYYIFKDKI
ncbi:PspC domain-containing protein [Chitinophaga nivalis]|uniref:PspC domain-containing protein n=1 Tax=Chitinophaga nivalis TaxID=2991709 RepID=A0ABT3IVB8_9BACT|nr:PspC domain-containing protein [Chitinophaga nivalis]MCW3462386.1 PspC domain-containing protein [Chitinophaga nivalis]MCW3487923.1 PspC domain-containing protein [Chitinophaga nivalis]